MILLMGSGDLSIDRLMLELAGFSVCTTDSRRGALALLAVCDGLALRDGWRSDPDASWAVEIARSAGIAAKSARRWCGR